MKYPPQTKLSKKAIHLRIGMTKKEVFALLGTPTWARGTPLIWTWQNGQCNPVEVYFDYDNIVIGFNEGRAECIGRIYQIDLNNKYLCTNPLNKICV